MGGRTGFQGWMRPSPLGAGGWRFASTLALGPPMIALTAATRVFVALLQRALRLCSKPIASGPAFRALVCLHQRPVQPAQDSLLGWFGTLDLRQAARTRSALLAQRPGGVNLVARRGVERPDQRVGDSGQKGLVSKIIKNNWEKSNYMIDCNRLFWRSFAR